MPLDVTKNTGTPKVYIKSSVAIELVAAIHYLSDRSHHSFSEKLGSSLLNNLSIDSLRVVKALASMRLQGIELFEFILKEKAFDDVGLLIDKIGETSELDFIYTFMGEILDYEAIQSIIDDRSNLDKLLQEKPKLARDSVKGLELLFYSTAQFKMDIIGLLKETYNNMLLNKLNSLKPDYAKHIEEIGGKLKDRRPGELSEEIMGRPLKVSYDFQDFYFIPCYFITPHKIRVYRCDSQMVVFAMEQNNNSINEIGDRVSNVFKIISDRTRLEILRAIIAEPTYGKVLAEKMNLTTATISHHVEVLKTIKLITEKRCKNIKYFEANEEEIKKLFDEGIEYLFKK